MSRRKQLSTDNLVLDMQVPRINETHRNMNEHCNVRENIGGGGGTNLKMNSSRSFFTAGASFDMEASPMSLPCAQRLCICLVAC